MIDARAVRLPAFDGAAHRRLALAFGGFCIAVVGSGLYAIADRPAAAPGVWFAALQDKAASDPIAAAVKRIEAEVAASPDNLKAWTTLAPVYVRLGRYADAVAAYRKLLSLQGEDAALRASLGEAETAAAGGTVTAEARQDFERSLALAPDLAMARYYLGLAAEQAGDSKTAIDTYQSLLDKVDDHPHWLPIIKAKLAALKGEKPVKPADHDTFTNPGAAGVSDQDLIQGMVAKLATRIDQSGGSADEWLQLIRAYGVLGEADKAKAALSGARKAAAADSKAIAALDAIAQEFQLLEP